MFRSFQFSTSEIISRDTSSYPITVAEVKVYSQYCQINPTDTTVDPLIQNVIAEYVDSWEEHTKYLILDQTIKSYIPNLSIVTGDCPLLLNFLNVRTIENIKYYPSNWNRSDAKTTLTNFWITPELLKIPRSIRSSELLDLFPVENNLETQIKGGFEDNIFTNLKGEIKQALIYGSAQVFDSSKGICAGTYTSRILQISNKYTLPTETITIF